jgi:hypothetical protein
MTVVDARDGVARRPDRGGRAAVAKASLGALALVLGVSLSAGGAASASVLGAIARERGEPAPMVRAALWPLHHARAKGRAPVVVPEVLRTQAFAIEQSSDGHAVVDLEGPGADPALLAPETLQLLDGRGVRIAKRVAVRKLCATACGTENSEESCHMVGDYEFPGRSLEQFALAFDGSTDVEPHALDRANTSHEAQLAQLARVFKKVYAVPENVYGARWVREGSGPKSEWIEESTRWAAAPGGRLRPIVTPTGARFSSCSLGAFGPLTEIRCPMRHTVYVGNRFIGMNDEFELGPSIRYSADIDGTLMFVVLLKRRNETRPVILFRATNPKGSKDPADDWYKVDAHMAHGAC